MYHAPTFWYGQVSLGTIENYMISVERYLDIVGDLRLNQLTAANNARFVCGLRKLGQSLETERKHCRHMNSIFLKIGPPGYRNRDALRFLKEAPWIRPPQAYRRLPREISDSLADSLYDATDFCPGCQEFPVYLEPTLRHQWWKSFILLVMSTAVRFGVAMNLTWNDLDIGFKYFVIPAHTDKKKRERRKSLNAFVLQSLQAIRLNDKLLYWPHGEKKFYQIWHELNEAACIMPHVMPHDLKRYSLQLAVRSGVDATTLQALGDHSSLKTTTDHYVTGNLDRYVETIRLPGKGGGT